MRQSTLAQVLTAVSSSCIPVHGAHPQRGRGGRNASPPRQRHPAAAAAYDSSPNLDMYIDDENEHPNNSASFYMRHDMNPPPLISRASRRNLQSDGTENNSTSDLDLIIEEAKLGNDAVTRLRRDLFAEGYYDKHAYPFDYAWHDQSEGTRTGVPIELDINFHRVFSVDTIHPVLDLIIWFRLQWTDPRLTWEPTEYGNMTKIWAWIGDGSAGGETSEIWAPDIELWNLETGLKNSLDDAYAIVSYDGSVYWTRPGHLRPSCKYVGLRNFPFDELTCQMEFGSWTYSGKYMRLVRGNDSTGYSLFGSDTAGSNFNEFTFVDDDPISCIEHVYPPYPASPEEDWPVLKYNVTVGRSWQPYARGYILLQVMLNIVGFSAFWLPPSCGERMGLSITAMMASVAADIVVAAKLPAAAELTWFQKFSIMSLFYTFISLLECVAVLYFFYKKTDNLIPRWYSFAKEWYLVRQAEKGKDVVLKKGSEIVHTISDSVKDAVSKRGSHASESNFDDEFKEDGNNEDASHVTPRVQNTPRKRTDLNGSSASLSVGNDDFGTLNINPNTDVRDSLASALSNDEPTESFAKPKLSREEKAHFTTVGSMPSRRQAIRLPSRKLSVQSWRLDDASVVPRDANDFYNEQEIESNLRWKRVSAQIDDFSRIWIPLSFFIALPVLFVQADK